VGKKWCYLIQHLEKGRRRYQRCCHYRKMSIEIKPQIAALEQSMQNAEFRDYHKDYYRDLSRCSM
jgi:hypothetical protein